MVSPDIRLARWVAWMPGVWTRHEWQEHLSGRRPLSDELSPTISFVDPMQRRRFSKLSKMLLAVAEPCRPLPESQRSLFYVFANQYGELSNTTQMLQALARAEAPSPMGFSLSVHNTAAGLLSIALADKSPATALAAGMNTLSMALVEAAAQLHDGADDVIVVYAEEAPPEPYQTVIGDQRHPLALGMRLTRDEGTPLVLPQQTIDGYDWVRGLFTVSATETCYAIA